MKKLLIILFCLNGFSSFAQHQLYAKKFNANKNAIYLTNSNSKDGLAFLYSNPKDTNRAEYLIENFKTTDIEFVQQKMTLYNVKFLPNNYITKKGDLVFTITSENLLIYFYHRYDTIPAPELLK